MCCSETVCLYLWLFLTSHLTAAASQTLSNHQASLLPTECLSLSAPLVNYCPRLSLSLLYWLPPSTPLFVPLFSGFCFLFRSFLIGVSAVVWLWLFVLPADRRWKGQSPCWQHAWLYTTLLPSTTHTDCERVWAQLHSKHYTVQREKGFNLDCLELSQNTLWCQEQI